jgi:hypothetical protein
MRLVDFGFSKAPYQATSKPIAQRPRSILTFRPPVCLSAWELHPTRKSDLGERLKDVRRNRDFLNAHLPRNDSARSELTAAYPVFF